MEIYFLVGFCIDSFHVTTRSQGYFTIDLSINKLYGFIVKLLQETFKSSCFCKPLRLQDCWEVEWVEEWSKLSEILLRSRSPPKPLTFPKNAWLFVVNLFNFISIAHATTPDIAENTVRKLSGGSCSVIDHLFGRRPDWIIK